MHQFDLKGVLLWHLFKRVFVKKKTTMRFDTFAYNKKNQKQPHQCLQQSQKNYCFISSFKITHTESIN